MKYIEIAKQMIAGSMNSVSSMVIYVAIVVLFIVGLVRCVFPVMRTRGLVRRAIKSIRDGGDKKYAWQEDDFLGKGALFAHWSDYLNNLFFADGRYHNASNVEDYINEETVIYGPGRISFAEALPGLLTSLGFLGTLIGLARGLSGFNMADSAAVQSSIVTLIPGMRYAFMTSIFGVVGSVAFTLITRMIYGSTEHTLTQFYSAMSRHAGVLSVDPMTQIAIYQQEQTALIKTMTKDLNGKFTENITQAIANATEPLNATMRGFVNGISKEQARLIDAVLTRFLDRMNESLSGALKRYGQTLDETSRLQKENCDAVRASLSGAADLYNDITALRGIMQELINGTSQFVEQLNAERKMADDAFMRINSAVEQMEVVSRQETSCLKTVGAVQTEAAGVAEAMKKAAGALTASAEKLAGIHADATRSISEELNTTLDAYRDYVNQFTQRVDYLASNISIAMERMPDAVNDANTRFLDQVDALTDSMEQARRAIDAAVGRMYRN